MNIKNFIDHSDVAVAILSCDKYSDVWNPFFALFDRYWNNCRFKVYLVTNEIDFSHTNITVLKSGKQEDWSRDTVRSMEQIKEKYVILLLEDYFLRDKVDQEKIERCIEVMSKYDATFMRLACFPSDHFADYAYDAIKELPDFCITRKEANYRVTLQAGLWNREKLIALIRPGESPWEFEVEATKRSRNTEELFLGLVESRSEEYVHGPIPYLCTALTKGVWMRDAIKLCNSEGINFDFSGRPVESRWKYLRRKAYHGLPFRSRKFVDFIYSKFRKII